jgi:hypothetical protein
MVAHNGQPQTRLPLWHTPLRPKAFPVTIKVLGLLRAKTHYFFVEGMSHPSLILSRVKKDIQVG